MSNRPLDYILFVVQQVAKANKEIEYLQRDRDDTNDMFDDHPIIGFENRNVND